MNHINNLIYVTIVGFKESKKWDEFFFNKKKWKTFVVLFWILKNISAIKLCHIIIYPTNALKAWIRWTELRDFSYNNTINTCWKKQCGRIHATYLIWTILLWYQWWCVTTGWWCCCKSSDTKMRDARFKKLFNTKEFRIKKDMENTALFNIK